ncbi:hypothetical protein [Arthrobacter sp. AQ5-05]|uniref:hypothetical protein n=1 Tax=Arthrobacter sp. AQ5-05 TaxID=2184581 RepID=UPI0011BD5CC2|nr:hypothetical protein [Arthrobacter sp. AQ5-05]
MTTSNSLLASLAIIKANWDHSQGSFVDNFLPFYLDAVKAGGGIAVSASDAKLHIRERFGIDIPEGVLSTLSRRAAQKNYGRRDNGAFIPDLTTFDDLRDLDRQKADYLRKQSALVLKLVQFSETHFQREMSVEEAEDALLNHIEEHSVPLLGSLMKGAPYDARGASTTDRDREYVVNAFIGRVLSSMPESFDHLETVVKGSMLAVSLYLPNNNEISQRFEATTMYLDTPVLLKALGYEGADAKEAAQDLVSLCRAAGAEIACFEHSVGEVRGILDRSAAKALKGGLFGNQRRATDTYFENNNFESSDILLLSQRLEDDILKIGIVIQERPPVTENLTIDELSLEQRMESEIGYSSRDTLLNDLDSLTAIHRLRGGRSSSRLERCRALLVTTNSGLARVGRSFFVHDGDHGWPPALTDHHLATLVWLKKPNAAPNLPRRQILADCFAALEPEGRIWDRYLEESQRLASRGQALQSDVMLLRYSTEAQRTLMDKTMGNAEKVTAETVAEILQTVKGEILSPAVAERDAALRIANDTRDELNSAEDTIAKNEALIKAEKEAKLLAENQVTELESRIQTLESAATNRRKFAQSKAKSVAKCRYIITLSICGLILVLSIIFGTLAPTIIPSPIRPFVLPLAILSALAATATLMFGGSIKGVASSFRTKEESRLENKYFRQLGD